MLRILSSLAACALATTATAGNPTYTPAELDASRARAEPVLQDAFRRHVVGSMPLAERAAASRIRVQTTPDFGPSPVAFGADVENEIIHMPIATVRFLDDLFALSAWFERHGCNAMAIQSYLTSALATSGPIEPPLAAFGIDRDRTVSDTYVNEIAGAALADTTLFLLAHEAGHIVLEHPPEASAPQSQAEEMAADRFALDRFEALGIPPRALGLYFGNAVWLDTDPAAKVRGTHPLSGTRLNAIADRLEGCLDCFTTAMDDPASARVTLANLEAEAPEAAADAFALDHLLEAQYRYGGQLAAYFDVAIYLDTTGLSRLDGVHPVTATRLGQLADEMQARAGKAGDPALLAAASAEAGRLRELIPLTQPEVMAAVGERLRTDYPLNAIEGSCATP